MDKFDQMNEHMQPRSWHEDYATDHENMYTVKCGQCDQFFYGYKRRGICKSCHINNLEEKLAELQRENEWVSVETRLPDTLGEHLVLVAPLAGCGFYSAAWYHDGLWEVRGENGNARDLITHWKPIKPPTEER